MRGGACGTATAILEYFSAALCPSSCYPGKQATGQHLGYQARNTRLEFLFKRGARLMHAGLGQARVDLALLAYTRVPTCVHVPYSAHCDSRFYV